MLENLMLYNQFDPKKEYDVIVVGSGPAGTTVAKKMARQGFSVLLLERGLEVNWIKQNSVALSLQMKNLGFNFSKEMNFVGIANSYGGASNVYCGTATEPAYSLFEEVGVDLRGDTTETADELWVQDAPDQMVGEGNLRLKDAALSCGFNWENLKKHIDMEQCIPNCGECMLTCGRGAKWTARNFGDDAIRHGADVLCLTNVKDVIVEDGRVTGVKGTRFGRPFEAHAKTVVLSSGVSNVGILRRAGIDRAGRSFACDFLVFTGGVVPGTSTYRTMNMGVGTLEDWEDGFIMTQLGPTWAMHALMLFLAPHKAWSLLNTFNYTWIMTKIQDETAGEIFPDNRLFAFSKPVKERDRQRMNAGEAKARRILDKMGGKRVVTLPHVGAHPCATCKIGDVVDTNLKTEIDGLYCCDASVFPRAMGLPVVWTVASLGNRLAKHLASEKTEYKVAV